MSSMMNHVKVADKQDVRKAKDLGLAGCILSNHVCPLLFSFSFSPPLFLLQIPTYKPVLTLGRNLLSS
jgi:hypothetical protein